MSFAVVMEGMTVIAYIVMIASGKQKRESGWKVLVGLQVIVGMLLGAAMSIIVSIAYVFLFDFLRLLKGMPLADGVDYPTGLFVRPRRSLLPWLETRYFVGIVHRQL